MSARRGEQAGRSGRGPVEVPDVAVALSSASVFPQSTEDAFGYAQRLGYDGLELMVWTDPVSQDTDAVAELAERYAVPVVAVHAPCLLLTQRVWSPDPWVRLSKSVAMASHLGASTVVVHPPFRWQRDYARGFVEGVARLEAETGVAVAVENMFPWRAAGRELAAYAPSADPTDVGYANCTLDLSHTAVAGDDALAMAERMGDSLTHVHLGDGSGSARDEHLVPGRGAQPCAALLERLALEGWTGTVTLEVTTRRARSVEERTTDLTEALAFARLHLASAAGARPARPVRRDRPVPGPDFAVGADGTVEPVGRR